VFLGLSTHGKGESSKITTKFNKQQFQAIDLTHDELAKEHIRHMVGGHSALSQDERLLRFEFPERPGALLKFLSLMRPGWNISSVPLPQPRRRLRPHFGGPAGAPQRRQSL
jgi:threonine dehydratase